MATRSLNKVMLIGNLTRDPELRYTPNGTPVCTIGLATNRTWTTDAGDNKEATEFHRLVAWAKLAELCAKLLYKGRRIYVEGRLQTRRWSGQDGVTRYTTEVVIDDMLLLDSRKDSGYAPQENFPTDYAQTDQDDYGFEQSEDQSSSTGTSQTSPTSSAQSNGLANGDKQDEPPADSQEEKPKRGRPKKKPTDDQGDDSPSDDQPSSQSDDDQNLSDDHEESDDIPF